MNKTNHINKRMSERNISELSTCIIYLFGSKLDKRDGIRLDTGTYNELIQIGRSAITC